MNSPFKKKQLSRLDVNFAADEKGQVFVTPDGEIYDLDNFKILDSSIDTVRQLYSGDLSKTKLDELSNALELTVNPFIEYAGHQWKLRRGGKAGFKFLLQNSDFGVVILVKSNYVSDDHKGTHCKIELSPKVIRDFEPDSLQSMLDDLAGGFFVGAFDHAGVAIHIATDMTGWEPPFEFSTKLTCRSQRVTDRNGFSELQITTGEVATVYGRGQSYTFGSASSLQCALYNKSREIYAHDKADYFEDIWRTKVNPDTFESLWSEDQTVYRLEYRFSHTVINQFAAYNNIQLRSFEQLTPYLQHLWHYGLDRFRYDLDNVYMHPIWTMLAQDVRFSAHADFTPRRKYKTPAAGNERNIALAFGNLLSIYARNKMTASQARKALKRSGLWKDLLYYYLKRGFNRAAINELIDQKLLERRLTSKYAA